MQFIGLHERHPALIDDQASRREDARRIGVELIGEKCLTNADWVGAVHDDHIKAFGGRGTHIINAIANDHRGARIIPGIATDGRQEFLGKPHHFAINFHHHGFFDAAMLKHALENAAIARADDQHALGRAMGQDGHMGDHFLIDEFIAFRDLHHAIQQHHPAMGFAFKDDNVLKIRLHPRQFALHTEALAPGGVKGFIDPAIGRHGGTSFMKKGRALPPGPIKTISKLAQPIRPRLCSASCTRSGRKPRLSAGIAL